MDGIRGLSGLSVPIEPPERSGRSPGASFADLLGGAIGAVDGLQARADAESEKVALGAGNLHEMAVALEKADVGFRVLTKIRNKVIEAYQEVMRMTV